MLLTPENALAYLMDHGLIAPDVVLEGDLMLVDASRRNTNIKAIRPEAPGLFLKQIKTMDPQSVSALQREAWVYWLAVNQPGFEALRPIIPAYHGYDQRAAVLVVEHVQGSQSLHEHYLAYGQFPEEVAEALGEAFGAYHAGTLGLLERQPDMAPDMANASIFPKTPPWVLSLHHMAAQAGGQMSGANAHLIRILQTYPEFPERFDALRRDWRIETLIHGDVKWDNVVVHRASQDEPLQVKLVDWELADFGDRAWDLGSILQAFIADWVMAMPLDGAVHGQRGLPEHRFEQVQPTLEHFWRAYRTRAGLADEAASDLLARSMAYGAARMVLTTYEYMQYAQHLSSNALALLQLSADILADPQRMLRQLLRLH
ncbi:MAG: phosphotransferase family protein [Geminicoccaceae bacterium]